MVAIPSQQCHANTQHTICLSLDWLKMLHNYRLETQLLMGMRNRQSVITISHAPVFLVFFSGFDYLRQLTSATNRDEGNSSYRLSRPIACRSRPTTAINRFGKYLILVPEDPSVRTSDVSTKCLYSCWLKCRPLCSRRYRIRPARTRVGQCTLCESLRPTWGGKGVSVVYRGTRPNAMFSR